MVAGCGEIVWKVEIYSDLDDSSEVGLSPESGCLSV